MKTKRNNCHTEVSKLFRSFFVCAIVFASIPIGLKAQDLIIKKDNSQIKAKILEIGKTEIKYKYFDAQDGPIITISKRDVKTVKIKGKDSENVVDMSDDPMSVSNNAILGKTSSLKIHPGSPLRGHIAFAYEWMFKPGFNFEAGLGIIGPNVVKIGDNKARGAFVKAGAKFLMGNSSDFEVEGVRYAHPLKGRYFKAEISYSVFKRTSTIDTGFGGGFYSTASLKLTESVNAFAFNLIYGKQYIFGNTITAGYYVGAGYGFESVHLNHAVEDFQRSFNRYSHTFFGSEIPITFTSGFNIGVILKAPEKISRRITHNKKELSYR